MAQRLWKFKNATKRTHQQAEHNRTLTMDWCDGNLTLEASVYVSSKRDSYVWEISDISIRDHDADVYLTLTTQEEQMIVDLIRGNTQVSHEHDDDDAFFDAWDHEENKE